MLKRWFAVWLCVFSCAGLFGQTPVRTHRVIFVVTSAEQEDWLSAVTLAKHYLEGIQPATAQVEVVAYGGGIEMLRKGAGTAEAMASTQKMGVHFVACQNAMKMHKLVAGDLLPEVTSVPSGVVELVGKQEAGWSYVKVGR